MNLTIYVLAACLFSAGPWSVARCGPTAPQYWAVSLAYDPIADMAARAKEQAAQPTISPDAEVWGWIKGNSTLTGLAYHLFGSEPSQVGILNKQLPQGTVNVDLKTGEITFVGCAETGTPLR